MSEYHAQHAEKTLAPHRDKTVVWSIIVTLGVVITLIIVFLLGKQYGNQQNQQSSSSSVSGPISSAHSSSSDISSTSSSVSDSQLQAFHDSRIPGLTFQYNAHIWHVQVEEKKYEHPPGLIVKSVKIIKIANTSEFGEIVTPLSPQALNEQCVDPESIYQLSADWYRLAPPKANNPHYRTFIKPSNFIKLGTLPFSCKEGTVYINQSDITPNSRGSHFSVSYTPATFENRAEFDDIVKTIQF